MRGGSRNTALRRWGAHGGDDSNGAQGTAHRADQGSEKARNRPIGRVLIADRLHLFFAEFFPKLSDRSGLRVIRVAPWPVDSNVPPFSDVPFLQPDDAALTVFQFSFVFRGQTLRIEQDM